MGTLVRRPAWRAGGPTNNGEIFLMNADGSGLTNLTNHPDNDLDPAWQPRKPKSR